jgi:hypothetical protein
MKYNELAEEQKRQVAIKFQSGKLGYHSYEYTLIGGVVSCTRKRFNWRGNRPRMGKRSMCGACGCMIASAPFGLCPRCGKVVKGISK